MDYITNTLQKLKIIYECINCQRTTNNPRTVEYIDFLNNICIDYYCEKCSKYL